MRFVALSEVKVQKYSGYILPHHYILIYSTPGMTTLYLQWYKNDF